MQEKSLSKDREAAGADVIGSPDGQNACTSTRPWSVLMALCLSAILPVLAVALAAFVIFNVCSGNGVIYYPLATVPLFVMILVQLVRVEVGLWKRRNWARRWVMEFALMWLIVLGGSLMSGAVKGSASFFAAVILVPVLSRIVPAILLVLPNARRWFKNVLADGV